MLKQIYDTWYYNYFVEFIVQLDFPQLLCVGGLALYYVKAPK